MRVKRILSPLLTVVLVAGCSSRFAGEYRSDVRLVPGKTESTERGYTLAEVRERLADKPRTLSLRRDGRYVLRQGDSTNEGNWRVEGKTLVLHDDTSNGNPIVRELQMQRRLDLGEGGEIIDRDAYSYYNLEEFYTRQ
ncbi:MAG: hypothetical protein AMXMBFR4_03810 [Candidatus Hydrogenedentota bacterium]